MSFYYQTDFPAVDVFDFATLHAARPENVEFVVECDRGSGFWKRHNSCPSARALRALLGPGCTVHVGATLSDAAHRAGAPNVHAVGKPLVFDLDLQDVVQLKVDKNDTEENDRWVRLVFGQVHVLQKALKSVFGFERFLAVYSGRRGCHLWVLDERAFGLTDEARGAICAFLQAPPDKRDGRLLFDRAVRQNPSFDAETWRAFEESLNLVVLASRSDGGVGFFEFEFPSDYVRFFDLLFEFPGREPYAAHDRGLRAAAQLATSRLQNRAFHEALQTCLNKDAFWRNGQNGKFNVFLQRYEQILFSLCWPSIDFGASAKTEHCTKTPFSLKSGTKRISLPIANLLPTPGAQPLPPIVTPEDLKTNPAKRKLFDASVRLLHACVAMPSRKRVHADGLLMDIEALA